ncbi:hypothetical protein FRC08_000442 [Ceratobasidium sp. 394]|nr:hypothetical protein FRC08_000442 [Ceratobasidium sp. 394]
MERLCGHLLPAVKNRVQPYAHLDNYVQRHAQVQAALHMYGMAALRRSNVKWTYHSRERLSSREHLYPDFPQIILGPPRNKSIQVDVQLKNQLTKYFGPIYREHDAEERRNRIDFHRIVCYGRFRLTGDGDRIRTESAVRSLRTSRDNSFVRFDLLPDANAAFMHRPDRLVRVTHYGQLMDIYYVEYIEDIEDDVRKPYLLARIRTCVGTNGRDASLPRNPIVKYNRLSTPDIHHINTIDAAVGRIKVNNTEWAIIDRSRNGARTQFVNEDGDDDDFD